MSRYPFRGVQPEGRTAEGACRRLAGLGSEFQGFRGTKFGFQPKPAVMHRVAGLPLYEALPSYWPFGINAMTGLPDPLTTWADPSDHTKTFPLPANVDAGLQWPTADAISKHAVTMWPAGTFAVLGGGTDPSSSPPLHAWSYLLELLDHTGATLKSCTLAGTFNFYTDGSGNDKSNLNQSAFVFDGNPPIKSFNGMKVTQADVTGSGAPIGGEYTGIGVLYPADSYMDWFKCSA